MSWQSEELEKSQRMQGDEKRERFEILTQRKCSNFAGRREKMENKNSNQDSRQKYTFLHSRCDLKKGTKVSF